jgi:hypothetical protein
MVDLFDQFHWKFVAVDILPGALQHEAMANWIFELYQGSLDIHIEDDAPFLLGCGSGNLAMVQCLVMS